MPRERYRVPRGLLMEARAALTLSVASMEGGEAPVIPVQYPGFAPVGVRAHGHYSPDARSRVGWYSIEQRVVNVVFDAGGDAYVQSILEHELMHHLQFTAVGGYGLVRDRASYEAKDADWIYDNKEYYSRPHSARRVEYYPNVVSAADYVIRTIHQKSTPIDQIVREALARYDDIPEELRDRFRRDVASEVARRLQRTTPLERVNPYHGVASRLDKVLDDLERIRDDADYTERVGQQAVRSMVQMRKQHSKQIATLQEQVADLDRTGNKAAAAAERQLRAQEREYQALLKHRDKLLLDVQESRHVRSSLEQRLANLQAEAAQVEEARSRLQAALDAANARMAAAGAGDVQRRQRERDQAMRAEAKRRR